MPVGTVEVPYDLLQPASAIKPTVATMCASWVIQDEASSVTYMEMVTASIGWMALAHAPPVVQSPQLTIEDVMDLPRIEENKDCL